MEKSS